MGGYSMKSLTFKSIDYQRLICGWINQLVKCGDFGHRVLMFG